MKKNLYEPSLDMINLEAIRLLEDQLDISDPTEAQISAAESMVRTLKKYGVTVRNLATILQNKTVLSHTIAHYLAMKKIQLIRQETVC